MTADGDSIVVGRLTGVGVTPATDSAAWRVDPAGAFPLLVREGDAIPGEPGDVVGEIGSVSSLPALQNDAGYVAFSSQFDGIYFVDSANVVRQVAKTGEQAPGFPPGWVYAIETDPVSLNAFGDVLFASNTTPGLPTMANAIFLARRGEPVRPVLQTGDLVEVAPGDTREYLFGDGRMLDTRGAVARLFFADGTEAIVLLDFSTDVPALGGGWLAAALLALAFVGVRAFRPRLQ